MNRKQAPQKRLIHPYYSSSPIIANTNESQTSKSAIRSTAAFSPRTRFSNGISHAHQSIKHQLGTPSNSSSLVATSPNGLKMKSSSFIKFRLQIHSSPYYYDESSSSINESSDDNTSIRTNPPTTPISSSFIESTSTSPSISKKLDDRLVLNAQPLSVSSSSSPLANSASGSNIVYVTSATASDSHSPQTNENSSAHTTYSRSSSLTSLSSFDVKSMHSSVPSEYSTGAGVYVQTSEGVALATGYMTPGAYSDLPDSPGEPVILNQHHYQHMSSKIRNEEISIMTVDSSKSNDITIVERTMLANNATFSKSANSSINKRVLNLKNNKLSGSNGSSAYNSESNSFLLNDYDDVVCYNVENSINNSCSGRGDNDDLVSIPSEISKDNKQLVNLNKQSFNELLNKCSQHHRPSPVKQLVYQNSNPQSNNSINNWTFNKSRSSKHTSGSSSAYFSESNSFMTTTEDFSHRTNSTSNNSIQYNNCQTVNSSIAYGSHQKFNLLSEPCEEDEESNEVHVEPSDMKLKSKPREYEDEEDERNSLYSVPSEIKFDHSSSINLEKRNFNELMSKLSKPNANSNQLLQKQFHFVQNQTGSSYFCSPVSQLPVTNCASWTFNKTRSLEQSINNDTILIEAANQPGEDDDQKILFDFIEEMFPKSIQTEECQESKYQKKDDQEKEREEEEEEEEENEEDQSELDLNEEINKCFKNLKKSNRNDDDQEVEEDDEEDLKEQLKKFAQQPMMISASTANYRFDNSNTLPKIVEEDDEEEQDVDGRIRYNKRRLSITSQNKKAPVIQMTKTARLRFENRLKKDLSANSSLSSGNQPQPKRSAISSSLVKENITRTLYKKHMQTSTCQQNSKTAQTKYKTTLTNATNANKYSNRSISTNSARNS
jgi:hypothetical protein